ncbi:unnamed protein product [Amoebophrya sp. A120]|nr:unnamed protein product [Amoebophrya sp. A120]|eukprot:GSA120T00011861001.1
MRSRSRATLSRLRTAGCFCSPLLASLAFLLPGVAVATFDFAREAQLISRQQEIADLLSTLSRSRNSAADRPLAVTPRLQDWFKSSIGVQETYDGRYRSGVGNKEKELLGESAAAEHNQTRVAEVERELRPPKILFKKVLTTSTTRSANARNAFVQPAFRAIHFLGAPAHSSEHDGTSSSLLTRIWGAITALPAAKKAKNSAGKKGNGKQKVEPPRSLSKELRVLRVPIDGTNVEIGTPVSAASDGRAASSTTAADTTLSFSQLFPPGIESMAFLKSGPVQPIAHQTVRKQGATNETATEQSLSTAETSTILSIQPVNRRAVWLIRGFPADRTWQAEQWACTATPKLLAYTTRMPFKSTATAGRNLQTENTKSPSSTSSFPTSLSTLQILSGGREFLTADDAGRIFLLSSAVTTSTLTWTPSPNGTETTGTSGGSNRGRGSNKIMFHEISEKLSVRVADTPVLGIMSVAGTSVAERSLFFTKSYFGYFAAKQAEVMQPLCGGWTDAWRISQVVPAQNGLRIFVLLTNDRAKRSRILVYLSDRTPDPFSGVKKRQGAEKLCLLENRFPEVGGKLTNLHVIADRYVFALQELRQEGGSATVAGRNSAQESPGGKRLVFFGSEFEPGTNDPIGIYGGTQSHHPQGKVFFFDDLLPDLAISDFAISPFHGATNPQLLVVNARSRATALKASSSGRAGPNQAKVAPSDEEVLYQFQISKLVAAATADEKENGALGKSGRSGTGSNRAVPPADLHETILGRRGRPPRVYRTTERDELIAKKRAASGKNSKQTTSLFSDEDAGGLRDVADEHLARKPWWRRVWDKIYLPKGIIMFLLIAALCSYTVMKQRHKHNYDGDRLRGKFSQEQILKGLKKEAERVQKEAEEMAKGTIGADGEEGEGEENLENQNVLRQRISGRVPLLPPAAEQRMLEEDEVEDEEGGLEIVDRDEDATALQDGAGESAEEVDEGAAESNMLQT